MQLFFVPHRIVGYIPRESSAEVTNHNRVATGSGGNQVPSQSGFGVKIRGQRCQLDPLYFVIINHQKAFRAIFDDAQIAAIKEFENTPQPGLIFHHGQNFLI